MKDLKITIDGKDYSVRVEELGSGRLKVHFDDESFEVDTSADIVKELTQSIESDGSGATRGVVECPLPGVVYSIDAKVGDSVKVGQKILSLIAMKMENEVVAPIEGTIKEINVKKDQAVNKGDQLFVVG